MSLSNWLRHLTGSLPIHPESDKQDRFIIRLNDTHCYAYYLLHSLFEELQIIGIIHTGGLSTSIDMKCSKHLLLTYEDHLYSLAKLCEKFQIDTLWIRPKLQDHLPSIQRILPHSRLMADTEVIHIDQLKFSIEDNQLLIRSDRGELTREDISLWQFRQLVQGVKYNSQIELINVDKRHIIRYALAF